MLQLVLYTNIIQIRNKGGYGVLAVCLTEDMHHYLIVIHSNCVWEVSTSLIQEGGTLCNDVLNGQWNNTVMTEWDCVPLHQVLVSL